MNNIEKNLASVRNNITHTAIDCERDPTKITLLAVSKTKPVADIVAAYQSGQRDFGENYLQEAEHKIIALSDKQIIWHYIGPIQSNKTRKISQLFDWVHSVDRLKIARRLNETHPENKAPLNILLQVNIDNEPSKSGILADEILPLAQQIESLHRLKLRGLMAIPAIHKDAEQQRKPFVQMREAFTQLQQQYPDCDTLSMGMSGDMQAAIAEGSTLVRIGTAIFGARTPTGSKSH
ncbi:MAG: YggS family pyridoxal phosphate-dependent enzyme [Gammaproteobacteria bacterium]|nr:YggS family pyridoxal phosphate-dependent enzyme [Gammaproteobacteria bacterium]